MTERLSEAYNELMTELFGEVPDKPGDHTVDYDTYKTALDKVQDKHGLKQGDPEFFEWVLTLVGRSPVILKKELN